MTNNSTVSSSVNLSSAYLEQNTPNPSDGSTVIRYHVPFNGSSAKIVITDMRGSTIKTLAVSGNGQISLHDNALAAGNYTYTLYVDGRQANSRQMIVAK
jgi:hypothetical protein